jgi:hypothetical protein
MIIFKIFGTKIVIGYNRQSENRQCEKPAWETIPKQIYKGRISAIEISGILEKATHIKLKTVFKKSDLNYKVVDISQLKKFVSKNNLAKYKYIKTERDCDDFEFMMQGDVTHWDSDLAFGIIWGIKPNGKSHAFNWCIGTDKELWFIEPQRNKVFKPKKLWKATLLVM